MLLVTDNTLPQDTTFISERIRTELTDQLLLPVVVFGRVSGRCITVLVITGGCVIPRVVAGRFTVGVMSFSEVVGCQVRERTGPIGSLLSIARFNLNNASKNKNFFH